MAWSGRFVLVIAAGILPIVALDQPGLLILWLVLVTVLGVLDLLAAGSPRQLHLERELPDRVRLGETVASALLLTNAGRRAVRAIVRDGWQPSAGASPSRARLAIPVGERRRDRFCHHRRARPHRPAGARHPVAPATCVSPAW